MILRRSVFTVWVSLAILAGACGGSSGPDATQTAGAGPNATSASGVTPGSDSGTTSSAERSAEVSEIQKTVEARNTESEAWGDASAGQVISVGGGVKTGKEARARLEISDGSILRLSADTEFLLTDLSTEPTDPVTKLKLDTGKIWVFVIEELGAGMFEIETPSGVATVRGSFMSVAYSSTFGHMIVTCLEGKCQLAGRGGAVVNLSGGEQSEILGDGRDPSPPRPMDASELNDWDREVPEARDVVQQLRAQRGTPPPTPPGGSSAASGLSGQTACDHPYLPLRQGATWTYSTESGPYSWVVNSVEGDTRSATTAMNWTISNVQGTYNWKCDTTGIVSYEFGAISSTEFGQIAEFNVTESSGTFLPPANLLVPGYTWQNAYTLSYSIQAQDTNISATSTVSDSYEVTGAEPVTIGGQTFDGLQISRSTHQTTQVQMPGGINVPPTDFSSTGTFVMARGVGIVRMDSTTEGAASTSELTSFSIP
jgi:hypothetical protein